MSQAEVENWLKLHSYWHQGVFLEKWDWLTELGPSGALDDVEAYALNVAHEQAPRGQASRDWEPVLSLGATTLVGPSPGMLTQLLAAAHYFDNPSSFDELLLEQFHRFCLDFYQGYQIREHSFEFSGEQLIIQGYAYSGDGPGSRRFPFTTLARQGQPVQFILDKAAAETLL